MNVQIEKLVLVQLPILIFVMIQVLQTYNQGGANKKI